MVVAVFGSSSVRSDQPDYLDAERLGAALARAGFTVATGGYQGIMEAVSKGARQAGGEVVGVTAATLFPGRHGANEYVTREIPTGTLAERLHQLIEMTDGQVVLTPSLGTLTELIVAWNIAVIRGTARPIVAVGEKWDRIVALLADALGVDASPITRVDTVDEAHEVILRELG